MKCWKSLQKHYKFSPPQIKITFFYIIIYLLCFTYPCKNHLNIYNLIFILFCWTIYIYIYNLLFHFISFYTYTECKSQTILQAQHWIVHNIHPIIVYKVKYWELQKIPEMDSSECITRFLCITGQYWLGLNEYLQFTMGLFESVIMEIFSVFYCQQRPRLFSLNFWKHTIQIDYSRSRRATCWSTQCA
jgi:hypothetical protein